MSSSCVAASAINFSVSRVLAKAGEDLDREPGAWRWARPNETMPPEDVQLIGTDSPATPTYRAPRGTTLDAYLNSAATHAADAAGVFEAGFDAGAAMGDVLGALAGGRPVQLAGSADGRPFAPFTIRRLVAGKHIGLHHDLHWGLELYRELAGVVDTSTLVSFVAALRTPTAGGDLVVYGAISTDPAVPRLANGFAYDLEAVESRYPSARVSIRPGDLFLLAAGRCLHRVECVGGPLARITMGGFLALDRLHERVFYWS